MNFEDLITIENICAACEKDTQCDEPCAEWYNLLNKILEG